jgi:hypothetical protein
MTPNACVSVAFVPVLVAKPGYLAVAATVFHQELDIFSTAQASFLMIVLTGVVSRRLSTETGTTEPESIKEILLAIALLESQGTDGTNVLGHSNVAILSATDSIADLTGPVLAVR